MEQKIPFTGRDIYNIVLLFLSLLTENTNRILILAQSSSDNPKATKIASFKKSMLERVWRKGNPPTLLVGMQTSTATMKNSVEIP